MAGRSSPRNVSLKLHRIAKLAREMPQAVLTTLAHHIDMEWLEEAHRRTRKDAAVGVDGQTAEQYAAELEQNLRRLLNQAKSGSYRAPPVRRVEIPKDAGKTRPLGIPTYEDKVLQRAVAMVLEAVYEEDFLDLSYGYRPGRSAHQALEALREHLMSNHGGWVIEVDIQDCFGTLDHRQLREMLAQRVRDGVLTRLVGKWLQAGVLEEGQVRRPQMGTPQGGVISPLLANIYLHEVFDKWFEQEVRPRIGRVACAIRYADDIVIVVPTERDAQRVMTALPQRFARYGLRVHPDKTKVVAFRRPRRDDDEPGGRSRGGSFDFLGFTHYWGYSRKGHRVVKQKTAKGRFKRSLRHIALWCRRHRHERVKDQHRHLCRKLTGHYGYYGVTGNFRALSAFLRGVQRAWRSWLDRRSQRARMSWERFGRLLQHYPLPPARIVHRYGLAAKP